MEKQQLAALIMDYLPTETMLTDTDNLISQGLTSLKIMRISSILRKQGIKLSLGKLMDSPTLGDWFAMIQEQCGTSETEQTAEISSEPSFKTDAFPLTDVQSAYWFGRGDTHALGGVGCHAYVEFNAHDIDIPRLQTAWSTVLHHHPMLRAVFQENLKQKIAETPYSETVIVKDFRESADFEEQAIIVRNELSHRKLLVEHGENAGLTVLLFPNGQSRICFDVDLLVADVQSFSIILRDLETAYAGEPLPKSSQNWDFSAYLQAQQKNNESDMPKAKRYWRSRLESLPSAPDLALDIHPNEVTQTRFHRNLLKIHANEWTVLKTKAQEFSTTPAMLLLTAYAWILGTWSSQKQFFINMPIFNRNTAFLGAEDAVADFTTLELLAVDIQEQDTFAALLRKIETQFRKDMEYTAYSGIKVERDLMSLRDTQQNIAPVVFACNIGTELVDAKFKKTFGEITYMISQTPQVWLDFQLYEDDGNLLLCWDSVEGLFAPDMLTKMQAALGELLQKLTVEDWNIKFCMLPKVDLQTIQAYNQTEQAIAPICLHELFDISAERYPDQIAVQDATHNITYAELQQRSNAVASALIDMGIQTEDTVGVLAERQLETIINILGIQKAGGAYVPIDPTNPEERQQMILKNANCRCLLSHEFAETHTEFTQALPKVSPNNLAYIIYTSGSTGTPKGVTISHKAVSNTIQDINARFAVDSSDVIIGLSSMCFDLSVYDIFGTLAVGAKLIMISDIHDVNAIIKTVRTENVTIWNSVPAVMQMMIETLEHEKKNPALHNKHICIEELRLVMMSGD